ncbi:MAG: Mrp/NBP35 family ATP-binding protein [Candidatus Cloacimonetes bacterium]|nr:Mrp/NBP35 family ATP-binding protein [Candidatus Cloacimonadota bacterium]
MSSENTQADKVLQEEHLKDNLSRIKHKIVIISGKGGVGKSTVAVNLAYGLALQGKKVGILDVDIHGPSIAKMLGVENKRLEVSEDGVRAKPLKIVNNLYAITLASMLQNPDDPVIWRGPLKIGAIKQFLADINWPDLDYLVVDCPPGTGDEPLSAIQTIGNMDGAIIVSTPQDVALLDARKSIRFAEMLNVPVIGLVENMGSFSCPHCGEMIDIFKGTGVEKAAADFKLDILGSIPIDSNIVVTGDSGRPYIYDFGKTKGAEVMQEITKKVIAAVEK